MDQDTVSFEVREAAPGVRIIAIDGEVTPASEAALTAAYDRASADGSRAVILDFEQLGYMNSGGIGLLVTLLVRAQRAKVALLAFGLSDHYRQILELTRLDEAIAIHTSETDAVAAASA